MEVWGDLATPSALSSKLDQCTGRVLFLSLKGEDYSAHHIDLLCDLRQGVPILGTSRLFMLFN